MYIRPTYGEVRLMTLEQKKIHMQNMQKLRDEKDFIKYGINYKHQKDYQKKDIVKNRLKDRYHKNKIDNYNEKLVFLLLRYVDLIFHYMYQFYFYGIYISIYFLQYPFSGNLSDVCN